MATVRLTTLAEAGEAALSGRVRDQRAVHLLDGVPPSRVAPSRARLEDRSDAAISRLTPGEVAWPVDPPVQQAPAELRTDLDRFSQAECVRLMELGYRLTSRSLEDKPHPLAHPLGPFPWSFCLASSWMTPGSSKAEELAAALRRGRPLFFKWFPGRRRQLTELHSL